VVPSAGYPLRLIPGRQLRGGGAGRAVAGLAVAAGGVVRALGLLASLHPRVVVGVGGYASVAVVVAAALRRIPTVLLEQNVIPGAANRFLGRFARLVCVGFAESSPFFPPERVRHTGNPIRPTLLRPRTPHDRLGLLVFGGSGGAHRLNLATLDAVRELGRDAAMFSLTHQTGSADVETLRAGYAALGVPARVEPFIDDMAAAYAAADLVVARAGATSCAEITAVGLPAILVPYPYAADDHQRRNAEVLVRAGAAEMIADADLTGMRLAAALRALLADAARRDDMATRAKALGRPDAADRVAAECLAIAGRA